MKYITEFQVEGRSVFPTDMLRYDDCMPATYKDVDLIVDCHDADSRHVMREQGKFYRVTLVKHHPAQHCHLTPERWRSFQWAIVDDSIKTLKVK